MTAPTPAGRFLESVYTAAYGTHDGQPYRGAILRRLRSLAGCLTRPGVEVPRDVRDSKTGAKWDRSPLPDRALWMVTAARREAYGDAERPEARGSRERAFAVPVPGGLVSAGSPAAPAPVTTPSAAARQECPASARHFVMGLDGTYRPARAGRLVRFTGQRHARALAKAKRLRALRLAEAA